MKEKIKEEMYAERWLTKHGFNFSVTAQWTTKTVYAISKDGIDIDWELKFNQATKNMSKVMDNFERQWDILAENVRLKQLANMRRGTRIVIE